MCVCERERERACVHMKTIRIGERSKTCCATFLQERFVSGIVVLSMRRFRYKNAMGRNLMKRVIQTCAFYGI